MYTKLMSFIKFILIKKSLINKTKDAPSQIGQQAPSLYVGVLHFRMGQLAEVQFTLLCKKSSRLMDYIMSKVVGLNMNIGIAYKRV